MKDVICQAANETHKLMVFYDKYVENPREESNLGTMICFHGKYTLGDKHDWSDPEEFLRELVDDSIEELTARPEFMSKLYRYWKENAVGDELYLDVLNTVEEITCSKLGAEFPAAELGLRIAREDWRWVGYMLDEMDEDELQEVLDSLDKYIILPLYLYDHGGITMSTGPFSCPWDSGQLGWIYALKQRFIDETGWTEDELFSSDPHRSPAIGEHVKVKGREDWGEVVSKSASACFIDYENKISYIKIDLDWNKGSSKKPENIVTVLQEDVTEVMASRAVEMLEGEVKAYDLYLRGECYRYDLIELCKCECCGNIEEESIDSCGGLLVGSLEELKVCIKDNVFNEFHDLVDSLDYAR